MLLLPASCHQSLYLQLLLPLPLWREELGTWFALAAVRGVRGGCHKHLHIPLIYFKFWWTLYKASLQEPLLEETSKTGPLCCYQLFPMGCNAWKLIKLFFAFFSLKAVRISLPTPSSCCCPNYSPLFFVERKCILALFRFVVSLTNSTEDGCVLVFYQDG